MYLCDSAVGGRPFLLRLKAYPALPGVLVQVSQVLRAKTNDCWQRSTRQNSWSKLRGVVCGLRTGEAPVPRMSVLVFTVLVCPDDAVWHQAFMDESLQDISFPVPLVPGTCQLRGCKD